MRVVALFQAAHAHGIVQGAALNVDAKVMRVIGSVAAMETSALLAAQIIVFGAAQNIRLHRRRRNTVLIVQSRL